jgi:aspartate racemase
MNADYPLFRIARCCYDLNEMSAQPKHIGIVACSVEGAALCFREIASYSSAFMGEHMHPQVTLSCIAMGEWLPAFDRGDYPGVADFMLRETKVVAEAGAQLAICPDNSAHLAFEYVIAKSPIPWLHIAEEVAKAAVRSGHRHAALLGTRFTMTGSVYRKAFQNHGMRVSAPSASDQQIVDDIIFRELVNGIFNEASRLCYNEVIERMRLIGCDCVILGCTEIPLLVRPNDCPLPSLDSTRLLARAAVDAARGYVTCERDSQFR